eukprot:386566_1
MNTLFVIICYIWVKILLGAPINQNDWNTVYNGYGNVTFNDGSVILFPKASTSSGETHAALIITKKNYTSYNVSITANTMKQLRQNSTPNSWEVFWVFFNYEPIGTTGKNTNYFILKTNGVELGTASASVAQQFLYTNTNPKLSVNTYYEYNLVFDQASNGGTVDIYINGTFIVTYKNSANSKKLYTNPGNIGLYCEDSEVKITDFTIVPL